MRNAVTLVWSSLRLDPIKRLEKISRSRKLYCVCINSILFCAATTCHSELYCLQNESRLWQEWEQLEAEKLLFKEQQQTFEEERLKYLDAAKRLDREVHI